MRRGAVAFASSGVCGVVTTVRQSPLADRGGFVYALVAGVRPARLALRVDPVTVLRSE